MSFTLYIIGFLILFAGLVYGATLMHVPTHWIVVGAFIVAGAGVIGAVKTTRQKDPQ